jgi:hypothetical protein
MLPGTDEMIANYKTLSDVIIPYAITLTVQTDEGTIPTDSEFPASSSG